MRPGQPAAQGTQDAQTRDGFQVMAHDPGSHDETRAVQRRGSRGRVARRPRLWLTSPSADVDKDPSAAPPGRHMATRAVTTTSMEGKL
jgi:hypothetical protein